MKKSLLVFLNFVFSDLSVNAASPTRGFGVFEFANDNTFEFLKSESSSILNVNSSRQELMGSCVYEN